MTEVRTYDAIDRQALRAQFNHLDEVYDGMTEEEKNEAYIYGQIIRAIDDAPPVTPDPKTGKWIDKKPNLQSPFAKMYWCDQCGAHAYKSAYCPGCGAKMEGEKID